MSLNNHCKIFFWTLSLIFFPEAQLGDAAPILDAAPKRLQFCTFSVLISDFIQKATKNSTKKCFAISIHIYTRHITPNNWLPSINIPSAIRCFLYTPRCLTARPLKNGGWKTMLNFGRVLRGSGYLVSG